MKRGRAAWRQPWRWAFSCPAAQSHVLAAAGGLLHLHRSTSAAHRVISRKRPLYHSAQSPLFSQTFPQSRLTIALSCSIAFYGSPRPPGSSPRDPPSPPPADLTPDYSYFLLWEGLGLHDTQFEIPFLGPFSWRTPIHPTEPARLTCTLQCPPCLAPDINRPLLHSPGFPPLCKLPEDRNMLVLAMACLISWTLGSWRTCLSGPAPRAWPGKHHRAVCPTRHSKDLPETSELGSAFPG